MERNDILREILSDSEIMEKYNLKEEELKGLVTNPPYHYNIVEVLSTIINENDNHLSDSMIYKKIKKIHNIS